ncbi:MAG: redoxin domain-containing protein [Rhizobiales bacterium]|nr:redoxin domain-containing protein [Hyphomicrobiales bacterium]
MGKSQRLIILALLASIAALAVLLVAQISASGPKGEAPVVSTGKPQVGGPFTLTDETGKTVTQDDFKGQFMLIYFGFTFCPDVCPTELQVMAAAINALGDDADQVTPILITVDPARDTPEVMAKYVPQFSPRLKGLTGTPEQIAQVAKEYRVFYEKVQDDSSTDYTMDHSSIVYLMGPDGQFLSFFPPATSPDEIAAKIKSFIG